MQDSFQHAADIMKQGGIIAYPTEGVYGLGCDPFNEQAVLKILALKQREVAKGLILIASDWQQIEGLILEVDEKKLEKAFATWPGPFTWVFPASKQAPTWICGNHPTIALRLSAHPICQALCHAFNGPLVSTSANYAGQPPVTDIKEFKEHVDFIVPGKLGGRKKPSEIRDVMNGKIIR